MIRILHSVSNMDRAGIETMLMNYYRHIDRSKIQFDFLCNKKKPGAYDAEIKEMGGNIYHTPGLNPAKYPSYLKCMKKIFEENPEYKIVEAHNGALGVYALHAAKVNHIPVRIFHAHGASIVGNVGNANEWYQAFDCFVLPSVWEGLPVVGVEAQAADLPCIFSSAVTREIGLSDRAKFIPLTEEISTWATEICNALQQNVRNDNTKLITEHHYNIEIEAKKLQERYLQLAGEVE